MVRAYGSKVNKRKEREPRYDREVDEEEEQPKSELKQKEAKETVKKAKIESSSKAEEEQPKSELKQKETVKKAKIESSSKAEEQDNEEKEITEEAAASADEIVGGIPIVLSDRSTDKPGVVFVLEKASLEVGKVGKTYQLLNSDDHANFLKKNNRNPADYRPDITHQALLMILDSPVNKAGRLKAVYVRTEKGVLFEVKPHVRIPRTFKRFAGIMLQLLQKLSITAVGSREKLLRCIKNPVEDHLPVNSRKIGFSHSSEKLVNMQKHLATVCNNDTDTVFVVGAMAHGKIKCDYIEDFVSISEYPLSAAYCISRICEALSTNWNII